MDRRSLIKNAGIAGVLAAGVAPAVHAQEVIRWRIASSFPKSLDTIYGTAETFAKKVGELSGGKFVITAHPAGEIIPPVAGMIDNVQKGTLEAVSTAAYFHFGVNDAFAFGTAIPFGLNSRQQSSWYYDGNGLKLMRELFAKYNIVNIPMGNTGSQMGGFYRKEIKTLADLKGLKMRIGGFGGKVASRMGVIPQNIPAGEIYQALEKGTVDAAEFVGPYDDQKLGLNKVAPFYYYPGWWEGGAQIEALINKTAYDKLSGEQKAMLEAAAAYAHMDMQGKYDNRNAAALKQLAAAGTKLLPFPKVVMDEAFKQSGELYAELSASNPDWKKIYADWEVFRRDANLWFRFTEARMDGFMQAQKL